MVNAKFISDIYNQYRYKCENCKRSYEELDKEIAIKEAEECCKGDEKE